jgi:hypothetical protein
MVISHDNQTAPTMSCGHSLSVWILCSLPRDWHLLCAQEVSRSVPNPLGRGDTPQCGTTAEEFPGRVTPAHCRATGILGNVVGALPLFYSRQNVIVKEISFCL